VQEREKKIRANEMLSNKSRQNKKTINILLMATDLILFTCSSTIAYGVDNGTPNYCIYSAKSKRD
jgi:hypothetical protein